MMSGGIGSEVDAGCDDEVGILVSGSRFDVDVEGSGRAPLNGQGIDGIVYGRQVIKLGIKSSLESMPASQDMVGDKGQGL